MLDAGGGGGYTGTTNWYQYNVEQMWALVAHHETDSHWKHVSAWKKTYELTSTHLWRLKDYRENLAAAWPPEKSAASRAFMERLDYLISHVESVYKVASENYTVFSTATSALSMSRYELKKIYDEYVQKKRQKQEYEERVEAEKASLLPGVSLGKPPVTDGELEQLNAKARSIMYELGGTLVEARVKLQKPEPYIPPRSGVSGRDDSTSASSSSAPPPVIPPVVPIGTPPPPPLPPAAAPTAPLAPPPVQQAPSMGPVLGQAGPITAPPPPPTTAPPVITPGPTPTPGLVPPPTVPLVPGKLPSGGKPPIGGGPSPVNAPYGPGSGTNPMRPGAGGLHGPGAGGAAGLPRVMPPGGLIGGGPGAGLGQPAAAQPPRRVNPVGGVIGGQRTGAGGAGAAGHGAAGAGQPFAPHGARPGQAGRRRDEDESTQRWDPDNPWQVDEGVDGVVGPAKAPGPVDPGPAIGLDR